MLYFQSNSSNNLAILGLDVPRPDCFPNGRNEPKSWARTHQILVNSTVLNRKPTSSSEYSSFPPSQDMQPPRFPIFWNKKLSTVQISPSKWRFPTASHTARLVALNSEAIIIIDCNHWFGLRTRPGTWTNKRKAVLIFHVQFLQTRQ